MTEKKIKEIKRNLKYLANDLAKDILYYKKSILKKNDILQFALYKNMDNLFQDIEQCIFKETKIYFYKEFYRKYYDKYINNPLVPPIILEGANIIKYLWMDGDNNPIPADKVYIASLQEMKNLLNEFFQLIFNTIFYYSYKYNILVENYTMSEELFKFDYCNEDEYKDRLKQIQRNFNFEFTKQEILNKELLFYKKAINKIIENLFYFEEKTINTIQTHQYFLRGIKLNKFKYKIDHNITIRKLLLNEKERNNTKFSHAEENCIFEYRFKIKDLGNVYCKPQLLPIVINLALKNCAIITKTYSFLNRYADGISEIENHNRQYDGGIPTCLSDVLIKNLPNVIKLVQYYIDNIENKEILFLKIAIDFYTQAINKTHPTHQITYCCLALEALFNTNTEKITKQLRDRCSYLLSLILGLNKKQISKNINKAYESRCSYVHGQDPTCNKDDNLASNIFDYTRFSILIFLNLISDKMFSKKFKTKAPNLNFKNYINEYYLNNINLMYNLKNELQIYLNKSAWINNFKIEKAYCRLRDLELNS